MSCIYTIGNKVNDLVYVGQTVRSVEQRWKEHIRQAHSGAKDKFHESMREIGIENFYIKDVLELDNSYNLDFIESYQIAAENSYHNGYNSNGGPCGDLREQYLDNQIWNKVLVIAYNSGEMNLEELIRLNEILKRGMQKM